jgi:phosphoadenosine phosphosulfate reductase
MLIPSHRHTDADLAMWRELEAADRLHGRSRSLAAKVDRAMNVVREFLVAGPAYCSVSWGKDSVVVADMVRRIAPQTPLVWVKVRHWANPDCEAVMGAFGSPCHVIDVDAGENRAGGTSAKGFAIARRQFGPRRVLGIRADESGVRRMSLRNLGPITTNCCRPLAWWNTMDVFGYLAREDLPIHPAYAMLGGGRWPREHLRVASLGGERGTEYGRALWEREYYGDILARIESKS